MEDRIQINGVWYVAEQNQVQSEVKTVNWMIKKLQELADAGCGEYKITIDVDYGNDYDTINDIWIMEAPILWPGRVHIS
jgi:hypothetical protein